MADIRLSEMPEINEFSSSAKIYGIAPGVDAGAFTKNAFLDLVYKSAAGLNKFTTPVEPTRVGNVITYPAGIGWLLQGVAKTNALNNVVTIPYAASGKSRIDLIVATANNQFVRVPGEEVTDPAALAAPVFPTNTLLASTILVGDSAVDYAADPATPVYVGTFLSQEDFLSAVPRAFLGYFGFVLNESDSFLAQYNGTQWIFTDLRARKGTPVIEVTSNRGFIATDKGKHLFAVPPSVAAEVSFSMAYDFDAVNGDEITVTALKTSCYLNTDVLPFYKYKNIDTTLIEIPKDCTATLKFDGTQWIVTIATEELLDFELQFTQIDDDAPQIVAGSLKGNRWANITPTRDDFASMFFTSDLPIFADVKDCHKNELTRETSTLMDSSGNVYLYNYYCPTDYIIVVTMWKLDSGFPIQAEGWATAPIFLKLEYKQ